MKLRWYDRILVGLGGMELVALGVLVALSAGGVVTLPEPFAIDTWLGTGWQWMPLVFLLGVAVCVWGCWLVALSVSVRREAGGRYYTVQGAEDGGLNISVQALEHLIRKVIDDRPEILSAQVRLGGQENACRVTIRAAVRSDVRIPGLVRDLREQIRAYVEECAGVKVESVRVIVESTKEGGEPRKQPKAAVATLPPPKEQEPPMTAAEPVFTAPAVADTVVYAPANPEPVPPPEPVAEAEAELFEPLPATLSEQAFPFPEAGGSDTDDGAEEDRSDA